VGEADGWLSIVLACVMCAVWSARLEACKPQQEYSLGLAGQDHRQGVLVDGGVVLGPAAGDKEAKGLAHGWLLAVAEGASAEGTIQGGKAHYIFVGRSGVCGPPA
jgi:hypothetical protein